MCRTCVATCVCTGSSVRNLWARSAYTYVSGAVWSAGGLCHCALVYVAHHAVCVCVCTLGWGVLRVDEHLCDVYGGEGELQVAREGPEGRED